MDTAPEPQDEPEELAVSRSSLGWVLVLGMFATFILIGVLGIYAADSPETVSADPTFTPTTPRPATTTSPPTPMITIECGTDFAWLPIDEEPDFSSLWDTESDHCRAYRPISVPLTDLERKAFEKSGYDDTSDVETLYSVCAQADPKGTYTSGDHHASPEQAAEIRGALVLCPDHPFADELKATAERGEKDAELEEDGRLFGSGTFLVGEEIQPGTYAITGDIENCYWERQNRDGEIIDNYFSTSARRVAVTIQAGDYAFFSEGCGQWRPA